MGYYIELNYWFFYTQTGIPIKDVTRQCEHSLLKWHTERLHSVKHFFIRVGSFLLFRFIRCSFQYFRALKWNLLTNKKIY